MYLQYLIAFITLKVRVLFWIFLVWKIIPPNAFVDIIQCKQMLTFNTIRSNSNIERVTYLLTIHFMYTLTQQQLCECLHTPETTLSSSTIPSNHQDCFYISNRILCSGWRFAWWLFTTTDPQKIRTLYRLESILKVSLTFSSIQLRIARKF